MSDAKKEEFSLSFVYTDEVLQDFAAMYREKSAVSPITRIVFALIGLAGLGVFVAQMVMNGYSFGVLALAILFGAILLLAIFMGRNNADRSVQRYRRYYLNKKAHFSVDNTGVELKLSGQKTYARSKFKEIYTLLETEKTVFLEIKGRAFYIIPKDAVSNVEDFKAYLQKKCMRHFITY